MLRTKNKENEVRWLKALDARKLAILKLVTERYIETGEPVGSKAVAEALSQAVSSATIRNDMAILERVGFLEQPYTSAGRIPTCRGYRFYIANLMTPKPLSEYDRRLVEERLLKGDLNPRTLITNATDLLAQITDCAVVSASSRMSFSVITKVEVIPAGRRLYALLLITSAGAVENRVCRLDFDLTADQLDFFTDFVRRSLVGLRVTDLTNEKLVELGVAMGGYMLPLAPLLYGIYDIANHLKEQRIEMKNETRLLVRQVFDPEAFTALLNARKEIENLLTAGLDGGVHVIFGDENSAFALEKGSLLLSGYRQAGRQVGAFGVIGPLRLDYAKIIPYLEYLSDTVSRLITDEFEEGIERKV